MSDDCKLIERLAYAVHDMRTVDKHPGDDNHPFNIAAAVLPILRAAQADALRNAAQMIRDACDRWEVDGDDERLVNEVLDPWTTRTLNPETEDQT